MPTLLVLSLVVLTLLLLTFEVPTLLVLILRLAFLTISLSGTNIFQTGNKVIEYAISPYNGVVTINNDGGTWALPQIIKSSLDSMLYNPYTEFSDVKYDFNLGKKAVYILPVDKIKSGRWKLKMDWKRGDKAYYQEEEIILQ